MMVFLFRPIPTNRNNNMCDDFPTKNKSRNIRRRNTIIKNKKKFQLVDIFFWDNNENKYVAYNRMRKYFRSERIYENYVTKKYMEKKYNNKIELDDVDYKKDHYYWCNDGTYRLSTDYGDSDLLDVYYDDYLLDLKYDSAKHDLEVDFFTKEELFHMTKYDFADDNERF